VVVTHRDADHVGGMAAVIQRHGVTFAADNGSTGEAPEAVAYEAALLATGTERVTVKAGARIVLDAEAGVAADVLWPPKTGERGTGEQVPDLSAPGTSGAHSPNDASVVLLLRYGEIRMLLTGDIEAPAEEALVAQSAPISAHVLKVAHHGSSTSTTPAFLRRVAPAAAVINVGADNRYGHPTQEVLNALAGIPVWRTDRHGAVDFITDGRSLWVRSERGRR
jgi:competence protein ComEC